MAAAFWGLTMTTFFGIIRAVQQPSPAPAGGVDAGGVGYFLISVVGGLVVLGLAIAFGMYQFARRNKALDPMTEASTARLYDIVEREGGEDLTTRSPGARQPGERDAAQARGGRDAAHARGRGGHALVHLGGVAGKEAHQGVGEAALAAGDFAAYGEAQARLNAALQAAAAAQAELGFTPPPTAGPSPTPSATDGNSVA